MLNWVAVLRRLYQLYNVKTHQQLAMAMGVPIHLGRDGGPPETGIPLPILEMVVAEKDVSWDWLLTGREHHRKEGEAREEGDRGDTQIMPRPPSPPAGQADKSAPNVPHIETRELERTLLGEGHFAENAEPAGELPKRSDESTEDIVRRLEGIRASLQSEIDKVERILDEKSGGRA